MTLLHNNMVSLEKNEMRKELIKMVLTLGSTLVLAILVKEYPEFLVIIVKSLFSNLVNLGGNTIAGMLTTSQSEITPVTNKKHKRRCHRGCKKHSRWKNRKAKNRKR